MMLEYGVVENISCYHFTVVEAHIGIKVGLLVAIFLDHSPRDIR